MFRVLNAISNYFPRLGYTQGINFWIGFALLMSGGNELDSFWFFISICRNHKFLFLGFFDNEFPLLKIYLHIFKKKLKEKLPKLYYHFKEIDIPDAMYVF